MKKLFMANWKMQLLPHEATNLASEIVRRLGRGVSNTEIVLAPSHDALALVAEKIADTNLMLGAQDCFWEDKGAYTGEISPKELKELGCKYVLAGHSERRGKLGETDEMVAKKVKAILRSGMTPVLCVGESLEEREAGYTEEVLRREIISALEGLDLDITDMIIAYEPIWAIGTGRAATLADVELAHGFIRSLAGSKARIIYGGSVDSKNMSSFLRAKDCSGALVGGASLKADEFEAIVRSK